MLPWCPAAHRWRRSSGQTARCLEIKEADGSWYFTFQYDIDQEKAPGDIVIERSGATVLIDETSVDLLEGCTIDFVDDLVGQSFKITNPNATASCGCGTSFAL